MNRHDVNIYVNIYVRFFRSGSLKKTAGMAWPLTQAEEETLCQVLKGKGIASRPWPELNCLGGSTGPLHGSNGGDKIVLCNEIPWLCWNCLKCIDFCFFGAQEPLRPCLCVCIYIYIYILCGSQRVFFPIRSSLVISSFWRNCWFIPIFPLFYRLVTSPKWYKLESTPTHVFSTLSCLKRTPTAPPRSTSTKSWPNWAVFKTLCHPFTLASLEDFSGHGLW